MATRELKNAIPTVAADWPTRMVKSPRVRPRLASSASVAAAPASRGLTRGDFTMRVGQSAATVGMAFFNSRVAISDDAEFYTFGGLSQRAGDAGAFYRR